MRKPTRQFNSAFREQYKSTLDYLDEIEKIKSEINYTTNQIRNLKERIYTVKISSTGINIQGGERNNALINYLAKLEKYEKIIYNKKSKLLDKQNEIEMSIDKLRYPQGHMLKLYYINDFNYERIAVKTFYSYKAVQHFIRQGIVDLHEILNKSDTKRPL